MSISNPPTPSGGFSIPAITGNPGVDGLIRVGIVAGASVLTTLIVTTLKITDPNMVIWARVAVLSVLVALAMAVWGYLKNTQFGKMIADAHLVGLQAGVVLQQRVSGIINTSAVSGSAAIDPGQLTHADAKAAIASLPSTIPKA